MLHHDTETPDVETASDDYASRFAGPVGTYFLDAQRRALETLVGERLRPGTRVLEIGGGHAQLTEFLLARGCDVCVQGSAAVCALKVRPLEARYPGRARFVASRLWDLPFPDRSFDLVIAVRVLAHVERWRELLAEMTRVARGPVVVDYAPVVSGNLLEPLLFKAKRKAEGNTRPFFCYRSRDLRSAFSSLGLGQIHERKQFFIPMVVHRSLRRPAVSAALERGFAATGLTRLLGAPSLLAARSAEIEGGSIAR